VITDIWHRIDSDYNNSVFDYTGSVNDIKLLYLTMASTLHCHMPHSPFMPVGSIITGETSTGKSELVYTACKLFPQDMSLMLGNMSRRSLYYKCMDNPRYLRGKILFIEEVSTLSQDQELMALMRILTGKKEGSRLPTVVGGQAIDLVIDGTASVHTTGLLKDEKNIREDNLNRLVRFETDASEAMTEKAIAHMQRRYTGTGNRKLVARGFADYHEYYQSFLEDVVTGYTDDGEPRREYRSADVEIPYLPRISFDTSRPDRRRKYRIFVDLLATMAMLNQGQREVRHPGPGRKVVISTEDDFHMLMNIISSPGSSTRLSGLDPSEKLLYQSIESVYPDQDFRAEEAGGLMNLGRTKLYESVARLEEEGLLESEKRGRYKYLRLAQGRDMFDFGVKGLS